MVIELGRLAKLIGAQTRGSFPEFFQQISKDFRQERRKEMSDAIDHSEMRHFLRVISLSLRPAGPANSFSTAYATERSTK